MKNRIDPQYESFDHLTDAKRGERTVYTCGQYDEFFELHRLNEFVGHQRIARLYQLKDGMQIFAFVVQSEFAFVEIHIVDVSSRMYELLIESKHTIVIVHRRINLHRTQVVNQMNDFNAIRLLELLHAFIVHRRGILTFHIAIRVQAVILWSLIEQDRIIVLHNPTAKTTFLH